MSNVSIQSKHFFRSRCPINVKSILHIFKKNVISIGMVNLKSILSKYHNQFKWKQHSLLFHFQILFWQCYGHSRNNNNEISCAISIQCITTPFMRCAYDLYARSAKLKNIWLLVLDILLLLLFFLHAVSMACCWQ